MPSLAQERCFHHAFREAVARCPVCARSFCRECIAEHEDRMLCAACLARVNERSRARRGWGWQLVRAGGVLFGLLLAWSFFLLLGGWISSQPDDFHARTLWSGD